MISDYQIMVPTNATDPQLVNILKQLLPEILILKFGYNSMHAKMLAEELAPANRPPCKSVRSTPSPQGPAQQDLAGLSHSTAVRRLQEASG